MSFALCLSLKIKVPHPSHPSTRISVQVPTLGIHFSPVRYSRIMELLNILYGTMQNCTQPVGENFQAELAPWNPPDLAAEAQILVWKVRLTMMSAAKISSYIKCLCLPEHPIKNIYIFLYLGNWLFCCCMAALFSCAV